MIELSVIRDLATIFGVLAGFSYYVLTVRANQKNQKLALEAQKEATETRRLQIFMQLFNAFNTKENLDNLVELMNLKPDEKTYREKYDSHVNPEFFAKRARVWYFYNSVGELYRMGLVDKDLLHRLNIDINVSMIWQNWGHIIELNRKRENMPDLWDGFEYLYEEIHNMRIEKGYPEITYNP